MPSVICDSISNIIMGGKAMFHWVAVIVEIILLILSLVYAFIIICSLIENTGYTVLSIIIGICHAVSPVLFVFFGYQCLLRRMPQYGIAKSLLAGAACCAVYFFAVSFWNRIVLGEVPEMWKIGLLTAGQVVLSAIFIYGFLQ